MIKNIIFDIGNVILIWQPAVVVNKLFPGNNNNELTQLLFKSKHWLDLNLGKISEHDLITIYHQTLDIEVHTLKILMEEIKASLLPIENSLDLLYELHNFTGYSLYALTDNVKEIMSYLKIKYHFWELFDGIIVSAEVGYLKPMPEIYQLLFNNFHLNAKECVFIDDHLPNVQGALAVGMHAIQFINPQQCKQELEHILSFY